MSFTIRGGRLVHLPIVPVTSCDGCGACCRYMGTPPGYAAFYPWDGEIPEEYKKSPDYQRWLNLPPAVEAALRAYYDAVKAGTTADRTGDVEMPCLWYDEDTRKCRHYEHRPQTCRDAISPGDPDCRRIRKEYAIP